MGIIWVALLISAYLLFLLFRLMYTRYVPVKGVPCLDKESMEPHRHAILDIRDYQEANNDRIEGALMLPLAYLGRYYKEIPCKSVHVIASNRLEKNLAIRLLKNKGYQITGYTLTSCNCQKKIGNLA
ncbi:rhodanese-like domain-containing protein [Gracilibacillus alcaliphilus]|uniref:hypothetical protein n=1 Tax=Gracilibacillus alcaliphilus TaxID=1401441 RepID=UPI00195AA93A|nr:hypothetical protein [Gracilibacillus alcaliphilus]MBM7675347.1 rhodanese-related sulfurtransferase [Gracilibacillus alcaliphilus]